LLGSSAAVPDLRRLVDAENGVIDRSIFWDRDIYDLELKRIFARCWLLIGHESQLAKPGDFLTSYMGEDAVIATRNQAGKVSVFLNSCAHRGNRVCFAERGNTRRFVCNYHGWSYGLDGGLLGMHQEELYEECKDFNKKNIRLHQARVETYKGLIFATFGEDTPSLDDYLGDFRWYLDVVLDNDADGTEFLDGCIKSRMNCNWKLPAENFVGDGLHAGWTHASAISAIFNRPSTRVSGESYAVTVDGHGYEFGLDMVGNAATLGYREIIESIRANEEKVKARLGAVRAKMTGAMSSATVFPNFSFLPGQLTFRVWHPKGPAETEIHSWVLVNKALPEEMKEMYRRGVMRTFSPTGLLEMDDGENWEHATTINRGYVTRSQKLDYTLGLGSETRHPELPGTVHKGAINEANQRAFYARWLELMQSETWVGGAAK